QVNSIATDNDPNNTSPVYVFGSQDNGTARLVVPNGQPPGDWTEFEGGDGGRVRFATSDPQIGYRVRNNGVSWNPDRFRMFFSTPDGGANFDFYLDGNPQGPGLNGDPSFPFGAVFAISPTNPRHVIIGSRRVWEGAPTNASPDRPVWQRRNVPPLNGFTSDNRPITVSAL